MVLGVGIGDLLSYVQHQRFVILVEVVQVDDPIGQIGDQRFDRPARAASLVNRVQHTGCILGGQLAFWLTSLSNNRFAVEYRES